MYCILGSKIDNLEKGLTWISQHAQVDLPRVSDDVLVLSASSMNEISEPISAAAVGSSSGDDGDDGFVGTLISHFESALKIERIFYGILLGVWLAFALGGLVVVIWHSGGGERYAAWQDSRRRDGDGPSGFGSNPVNTLKRSLPWAKEEHPIYDQHSEKPIPRIVEPGSEKDVYYTYDDPKRRSRGTIGSTLSALAAPGQAFLGLSSRTRSDDGHDRLTNGFTSEKYNANADIVHRDLPSLPKRERDDDESSDTAPQFWVNKWYRAVDSAKGCFPTRGQKHGAALHPEASVRSERSFGASQAVTPVVPSNGWPSRDFDGAHARHTEYDERDPRHWDSSDPNAEYLEQALEEPDTGSRYPTASTTYPRRLSRAPTMSEGRTLPKAPHSKHSRNISDVRDIFQDPPTPAARTKRDSLDYLDEEPHQVEEPLSWDRSRSRDNNPFEQHDHYDRFGRLERLPFQDPFQDRHGREDVISPVSSSASYFPDAKVESANRVQTGTAALAAILANMQERRAVGERMPVREVY